MRCGKHIMPETSVERFPSSGAARYPPFRATEPQLLRGTHAVTFLPLVFDIATIWLRLRRAGFFVALRAFVKRVSASSPKPPARQERSAACAAAGPFAPGCPQTRECRGTPPA